MDLDSLKSTSGGCSWVAGIDVELEVSQELMFSFSKPSQLDKAVEDLGRYNHDFRTLSSRSAEKAKLAVEKLSGSITGSSKNEGSSDS